MLNTEFDVSKFIHSPFADLPSQTGGDINYNDAIVQYFVRLHLLCRSLMETNFIFMAKMHFYVTDNFKAEVIPSLLVLITCSSLKRL